VKDPKTRSIRVLAADDSALMRSVLMKTFELHSQDLQTHLPPMELCGVVRDGLAALEAVERLKPDVLLLDLSMPRLDGMGVLLQLRAKGFALPVLLCSSSTEQGARETLEALSLGALDYVAKPSQQGDAVGALMMLQSEVMPRIAALVHGRRTRPAARPLHASAQLPAPAYATVDAVVIAASTGGPSALETILRMLPKTFAAPILIAQHMPRLFTCALADRLDRICTLSVHHAEHGEVLRPGVVYLAPGDTHMEVSGRKGRSCISLHHGEPLHGCRPAADFLFVSAARAFGSGTLGVVMTGMGTDGLEGSQAVCAAGGSVLAQDEASSAVWGMPGRVVAAGLASAVLPVGRIAAALLERTLSRPAGLNENMHHNPAPNARELESPRELF
jgi:two-component system chemotaxis response regulator CheB